MIRYPCPSSMCEIAEHLVELGVRELQRKLRGLDVERAHAHLAAREQIRPYRRDTSAPRARTTTRTACRVGEQRMWRGTSYSRMSTMASA